MTLLRWDPLEKKGAKSPRLNRAMPWVPPEILDMQDRLGIRADVPSLERPHVDVRIEDDVRRRRSEHEQVIDFEDESAHRTDDVYGPFTWSFSRPRPTGTGRKPG